MKGHFKLILLMLFCVIVYGKLEENEKDIIYDVSFYEMEIEDDYDQLFKTISTRNYTIKNKNNEKLQIDAELKHSRLLRNISLTVKLYSENVPMQIVRNWTLLAKPGDALLEESVYKTFVSFHNGIEEQISSSKLPCVNGLPHCTFTKTGYENILEHSRDITVLGKSWAAWQSLTAPNREAFQTILQLVPKSAQLNDQPDSKSYWEMMVEMEGQGAFEKADALWQQIQPLYSKLHHFVKTRIENYYKITNGSGEIPVYLLGSNFGHDWSHIAPLVLPHPQLLYDITSQLSAKSIQEVFKLAENLTEQLSLGSFQSAFWSESDFNAPSCDNTVIHFRDQKYSEVITCPTTSWIKYLDAYETTMKIAVERSDYNALSRMRLRYSAVDSAITSFGSILAIEHLPFNGILKKDVFKSELQNDTKRMSKLLLIALRVLPKLPFYLAADRWRLRHWEEPFSTSDKNWWKLRKELQGVSSVTNNESDYLADDHMITNKPYLSDFLGTILQFQLLDYYKSGFPEEDLHGNIAVEIAQEGTLQQMINDRAANEWPNLLSLHYGLFEVSAEALLQYFRPLEEYFEWAPIIQETIVTTTTTTTTTTTSTTTTTTTTEKPHTTLTSETQQSASATITTTKKPDTKSTIEPKYVTKKMEVNIGHSSGKFKSVIQTYPYLSILIAVTMLSI